MKVYLGHSSYAKKQNFNIENVKEFKYVGVHLYFLKQVLFVNEKNHMRNILKKLCTELLEKSDNLDYQLTAGLFVLFFFN